ncbi:MAG: hypothetical protein KDC98_02920 [Planctomycetes bacterium]|nr:hypothetical protein [Planctomycetota bacterium]
MRLSLPIPFLLLLASSSCGKSAASQPIRPPEVKVNATGRWVVTSCRRRLVESTSTSPIVIDCDDILEIANVSPTSFGLVGITSGDSGGIRYTDQESLAAVTGGQIVAYGNETTTTRLRFWFSGTSDGSSGTKTFSYSLTLDATGDAVIAGAATYTEQDGTGVVFTETVDLEAMHLD